MILTLTGNLLAERTLDFAAWSPGRTQRARAESFQVGGKGVNVSKMLHRLGAQTNALCFAGGATGDECAAWLSRQPWPAQIFRSAHATRAGLVVRAPGQPETTFLGPDAPPGAAALRASAEFLNAHRDPATVLALCGSFPGWADDNCSPLRDAVAAWAARAPLVADSHGPPLAWLVAQPVRLVKINRQEFDALLAPCSVDLLSLAPWTDKGGPCAPRAAGLEVGNCSSRATERTAHLEPCQPKARGSISGNSTATATADLAPRLRLAQARWPTPAWIITDGPRPVWFAAPGAAPTYLAPPPVNEVSATGSGDVFFACVLHALFNEHRPLADAVAFALPRAAANAAHGGVAEFDLNQLPPAPRLSAPDPGLLPPP